jgi:hypothetical protein
MSATSSELAPPAPSPASECVPPLEPTGGRTTLAWGWGDGGSQFGLLERKPGTLSTYSMQCMHVLYLWACCLSWHLSAHFMLQPCMHGGIHINRNIRNMNTYFHMHFLLYKCIYEELLYGTIRKGRLSWISKYLLFYKLHFYSRRTFIDQHCWSSVVVGRQKWHCRAFCVESNFVNDNNKHTVKSRLAIFPWR